MKARSPVYGAARRTHHEKSRGRRLPAVKAGIGFGVDSTPAVSWNSHAASVSRTPTQNACIPRFASAISPPVRKQPRDMGANLPTHR